MSLSKHGILHISDLHFGRVQTEVLHDLEEFLVDRKEEIQLVILTGDMTQRAKKSEFQEALNFLQKFQHPLFLVPGNHDVPLYNLYLRFLYPYKKFTKYLGPFSKNFYEDDHCAVFGLWTTNKFTAQDGKIISKELDLLEDRFSPIPSHKIKIIASHHPLKAMKRFSDQHALQRILKLDPHLFLWGHEHHGRVSFYDEMKRFPLLLASGTTISSRTREQANSFNMIYLQEKEIAVQIFHHSQEDKKFVTVDTFNAQREKEGFLPS